MDKYSMFVQIFPCYVLTFRVVIFPSMGGVQYIMNTCTIILHCPVTNKTLFFLSLGYDVHHITRCDCIRELSVELSETHKI